MTAPLNHSRAPVQQRTAAGGEESRDRLASMARGSWAVAAWVLVSRITGFGRIAVIAAVLGPTYFGNLFQFSYSVPALIYQLLSGSLVSAILVPPLVRCIDGQDQAGARRLASGFLGTVMAIVLVITVLGVLGTPLVLRAMTAFVQDGEIRREQLRLGWPLIAMMLPQLLCYTLTAVSTAVQQANGRFALAAAAHSVENLGTTAVLGASALLFGASVEAGDVSGGQLILLGLGTTASAALAAAVQWWGAYRVGLRLIPSCGWRLPEIRRMFRMGTSSVGYNCLFVSTSFGMLTIASGVPGGVAAYQITTNLVYLPIGLTAGVLAAVQLPQLSRYFNDGLLHDFSTAYRSAVRLVAFALLPAGLLMVIIPHALAQAVAFGGMASPAGVSLIAACVAGSGFGVLGEGLIMLGTSASYARRDAASPLRAMTLRLAISVIGMALAQTTGDPLTTMWILGATVTAASSVAALYLHIRQTRSLPPGTEREVRNSAANLFAATVAMGPAWLIVRYGADTAGGPWDGVPIAVAATVAAAATYLALQFARGSEEMSLLLPLPASLQQSLSRCRIPRANVSPQMPEKTRP